MAETKELEQFTKANPTAHTARVESGREVALRLAKEAVMSTREKEYSPPENSFGNIAKLWLAYKGVEFSRADVAIMLALLKIARLMTNPSHRDSWVDIVGYGACGLEVAEKDQEDA